MFNNYHYFIVLAEECNLTRAADRLFITHQNLSKYLANLEAEFGLALFTRKPSLSLTYAGRLLLETFKETELREQNLRAQFVDLRRDLTGEIRLGTTEGRFRILMPDIMSEFKKNFPEVKLLISSAASPELRKMVQNNQLDLMVANIPPEDTEKLDHVTVLEENLYLVISDHMLKDLFGDAYPACKAELRRGADMRLFQDVPFALNLPHMNSHILLKRHFSKLGISMNCIHTSSHPDLHHMMSARDFAASFCLTMYLPSLFKLNEGSKNKLNIFPIKDFQYTNSVGIYYTKNRIFPHYACALIRMITEQCSKFKEYDEMTGR